MAPTYSIKEFIVFTLERAGRPLAIREIYEAFVGAGYELTAASIRGRINTLTYEGRIFRSGHAEYSAWGSSFCNLIILGQQGGWDRPSVQIDHSRFLEYTDTSTAKLFEKLTPENRQALSYMPTLFAYEAGIDLPTRVGRLTDIHVKPKAIEIWFEFDGRWPEIHPSALVQLRNLLGFSANEQYRTHWAVKKFNLYKQLEIGGFSTVRDISIELPPPEPEAGPGPQYRPRDGKLSEDISPPTNDEINLQSTLHHRLRVDAARLSGNLAGIANRYPELVDAVKEYTDLLRQDTANLDIVGVWSVGGALAAYAQSYREQNISRTMAEPIEPQIEAQLQSLVRQHGAFVIGFSEGRDLVERADTFAVDTVRLKELSDEGPAILRELTFNTQLVDARTRALHKPIYDFVTEFGWVSSRAGYSAYLIVRNSIRAMIKFTVGENINAGVVLGLLSGASTLLGDPNAEFIRTAVPVLQQHGSQLISFFNHSPEMRSYVEWALHLLRADKDIKK